MLANSGSRKKIIIMHHPTINCDEIWNQGTIANNLPTFMDYCDAYKVNAVVSGHLHKSKAYNRSMNGDDNYKNGYPARDYPLFKPDTTLYVTTADALDGYFRVIGVEENGIKVYEADILEDMANINIIGCPASLHL